MNFKGFVKYKLPNSKEIISINGNWLQTECLEGDADYDFVISNFNNTQYFVFKAVKDFDEIDVSLCYREKDSEICLQSEEYLKKIKQLLERIKGGSFEKIIFSRRKNIEGKMDIESVFETLNKQYNNSLNYCFGIESIGLWAGATPEILIQSEGNGFVLNSLAGTKKWTENGVYKWTEKELEEQKYVTDYFLDKFKESKISDVHIKGPFNFEHGRVAHLKTELRLEASTDLINDLIQTIPPTPAVCGIPKELVLTEIEEIEGYNRRFYTGIIGVYKNGSVNLFVNLRCMEILQDSALLYIGGGITSKSDPQSEWEETEMKSKTLLDIL